MVLIENLEENLDPVLGPLLGRETIKKGRYVPVIIIVCCESALGTDSHCNVHGKHCRIYNLVYIF